MYIKKIKNHTIETYPILNISKRLTELEFI